MKIKKYYSVPKPAGEQPWGTQEQYGTFVCHTDDPKEHNAISGFAEDVWTKIRVPAYATAFVPSMKRGIQFLVNSNSKDMVKNVIDEAVDLLKNGFVARGLPAVTVEDCVLEQ